MLTEMLVFLFEISNWFVKVETKKLVISKKIKRRVEMIYWLKHTIINENVKSIKANIAMIKIYVVKIKDIDYLTFNECTNILKMIWKIGLKILKNTLKTIKTVT